MSSGLLVRLWRRCHPGDNPLVRPWDRLESGLLISVVVLALLAVPVLAIVGFSVYSQQQALAADQRANRYPVHAVLLEDAPAGSQKVRGSPATTEVHASWVSANGVRHEGTVPARYGAVKGTTVDIWLDANGELSGPPLTHREAATVATCTAVGAWLAVLFALTLLYVGVRALVTRARYADWEREWRRVSRDSTWP